MIRDVTEADFDAHVVERSREVPVVVDFWAAWCGPCRQLTPALEAAANKREGRIDLAKVDTDANQSLSQSFRIQGIPAVKAFKDGAVASEFTGAVPPAEVERFFDALVPSEAEELAAADDEASLRRALQLDPRQAGAAGKLGRILIGRAETEEALRVLEPFSHDFLASGLMARVRLTERGTGLGPAFEAWDRGDRATALEHLQEAFAADADGDRDAIRQVMVAIFTELGPGDPLAREHRRRLASALY